MRKVDEFGFWTQTNKQMNELTDNGSCEVPIATEKNPDNSIILGVKFSQKIHESSEKHSKDWETLG